MGAEPEGDVVVVLAQYVESLGLVEYGVVAVRGAVHQQELVARPGLSGRCSSWVSVAVRRMLRIGVTQRMNSSTPVAPIRVGVVDEQRALVGPAGQLDADRADHRPRGLGATVEHEECLVHDLVVVETAHRAVGELDLAVRPHRDQVVARLDPARGQRLQRRHGELEDRVHGAFGNLTRGDPSAVYWPPSYMVTSDHSRHLGQRSGSKPSMLADHARGKGSGQRAHDVALAAGDHRVDQLVDDAAHVVLVLLDRLRA